MELAEAQTGQAKSALAPVEQTELAAACTVKLVGVWAATLVELIVELFVALAGRMAVALVGQAKSTVAFVGYAEQAELTVALAEQAKSSGQVQNGSPVSVITEARWRGPNLVRRSNR